MKFLLIIAALFLMLSVQAQTVDITTWGAVGDGTTDNTIAISNAANHLVSGGTLLYPSGGTFLAGTLIVPTNNVKIDIEGKLLSQTSSNYFPLINPIYPDFGCYQGYRLISIQGKTNVTITGNGTIDGNGGTNNYPSNYASAFNPCIVVFDTCSNITISQLLITNCASWCLVPTWSDWVTISNVNIFDPLFSYHRNRDGIDICTCSNVWVGESTIAAGDDGLCVKNGTTNKWSANIVFINCVLPYTDANGLRLGDSSYGPFNNILYSNIFVGPVPLQAIAMSCVDGGSMSGITFNKISFTNDFYAILVLLGGRDAGVHPGSINNVLLENIYGTNMFHAYGSVIIGTAWTNGITYSPSNIILTNVNINYKGGQGSIPPDFVEYTNQDPNISGFQQETPDWAWYFKHINGLAFLNSSYSTNNADVRPAITLIDVSNYVSLTNWPSALGFVLQLNVGTVNYPH